MIGLSFKSLHSLLICSLLLQPTLSFQKSNTPSRYVLSPVSELAPKKIRKFIKSRKRPSLKKIATPVLESESQQKWEMVRNYLGDLFNKDRQVTGKEPEEDFEGFYHQLLQFARLLYPEEHSVVQALLKRKQSLTRNFRSTTSERSELMGIFKSELKRSGLGSLILTLPPRLRAKFFRVLWGIKRHEISEIGNAGQIEEGEGEFSPGLRKKYAQALGIDFYWLNYEMLDIAVKEVEEEKLEQALPNLKLLQLHLSGLNGSDSPAEKEKPARELSISWIDLRGKPFEERVEMIRSDLGWSLTRLAEEAEIDQGTAIRAVKKYKGKRMTHLVRGKIMDAFLKLGLSELWFLEKPLNQVITPRKLQILLRQLDWELEDLVEFISVSLRMLKKFMRGNGISEGSALKLAIFFELNQAVPLLVQEEITLKPEKLRGLTFGERVRKLREHLGWNVKRLMKESGLSETGIRRAEKGTRLNISDENKDVLIQVFENYGASKSLFFDFKLANKDFKNKTFGGRVRAARESLGWGKRFLADRAGLSVGAISDIENGITKNADISTQVKIVSFFRSYGVENIFFFDYVHPGIVTGRQLRLLRLKFNWTEEDLAREADVELKLIEAIESGEGKRIPSESEINKLLALFEKSEAQRILIEEDIGLTRQNLKGLSFGEKVQRLRENLGWSMRYLGKLAGISQTAVSNIENGGAGVAYKETKEALIKVFKEFGAREEWLYEVTLKKKQLNNKPFGKRVRLLRENLNLKVSEMAAGTGLNKAGLNRIEKNSSIHPREETLDILIEYFSQFGVKETWFFNVRVKPEELDNLTFGQKIRRVREKLGWRAVRLARKAGLRAETVRNIEAEKTSTIYPGTRRKLIQAILPFGAKLEWFEEKKEPEPEPETPPVKETDIILNLSLSRENLEGLTNRERLIQIRTALGWTKKRFSQETGISYGTIANYENNGKKPWFRTLVKVVGALSRYGVQMDWFEVPAKKLEAYLAASRSATETSL